MRRTLFICSCLVAATLLTFWPVVGHDFINYDDNCYIVSNPHIQAGLTWHGIAWAFGRLHGDHTYWHPLTWVSHMIDCQLFGLRPAGHHIVNLLIHSLNGCLVFFAFRRLTGAVWKSALLAAVFALHPLQVDTVAWVAERKNLLGATFFLLTLWAYAKYVQSQHHASRITHHSSRITPHPSSVAALRRVDASLFYSLTLLSFTLGLMCKPVLVTLPFLLLLLDYWPLRRIAEGRLQEAEKEEPGVEDEAAAPDAASKGSSWRRLILEKLPFLPLTLVSCYVTAVGNRAVGAIVDPSAGLPLAMRLQNAIFSYAQYLGKLLWPANLAIFYPYPLQFPLEQLAAFVLLLVVVSGLAAWRLFRQPYLLVGWCWFLGVLVPFIGLLQSGEQAMADRFMYVPAIGLLLMLIWGVEILGGWFRGRLVAVALALVALGCCAAAARCQTRYWQNSVTVFSHALDVTADNARSRANLGQGLAAQGKLEEGIQQLMEAVAQKPDQAVPYWAIGSGRLQQRRYDEAIQCFEIALRLQPDYPEALNNLAWLRATHPDPKYRDGKAAVALAQRACQLTGHQEPLFLGTLAAAYAEAGQFANAVATAEKARSIAAANGQAALAARNQQLLDLYRQKKPFHER